MRFPLQQVTAVAVDGAVARSDAAARFGTVAAPARLEGEARLEEACRGRRRVGDTDGGVGLGEASTIGGPAARRAA